MYNDELSSSFGLADSETPSAMNAAAMDQARKQAIESSIAKGLGVATTAGTAAALPFLATPMGAAAMIGSQAIMQIAAQKAADERNKRAALAQIEQNKGTAISQGLDTILEGYRGLK